MLLATMFRGLHYLLRLMATKVSIDAIVPIVCKGGITLHVPLPNIHFLEYVVVRSTGMLLISTVKSATAKFRMK